MKILLLILTSSVLFFCSAQVTTKSYTENFENRNEAGWTFTCTDADIFTESGELKITLVSDEFVHIFPPVEATKEDFSFKIKSGSSSLGLEGGGFGRAGFKSLIGIIFSDELYDDSLAVVYTTDIQSYEDPNLIKLKTYPIPDEVNSLQLDVIRSGNNLIINAFINEINFYSGQLENADEGLFSGNMVMMIDPLDDPGLKEWSLDEIVINYNPFIETPGAFMDEFDDINSPWFRFGDFENIAQSVSIGGGKLNFNYNGTTETYLYGILPIGPVKDFSLEVEGGAGGMHNAPFSISRFFDYRNYITTYYEDESFYIGYALNAIEPTIIGSVQYIITDDIKLKFSVAGSAPNLNCKLWVNDVLILTGDIINATERIEIGRIAAGYDRGNIINSYLNYASAEYSQFVVDVNESACLTPLDFILAQNYPNPFNPSTMIQYQLPEKGLVALKVYDVLGNEIVSLLNEVKEAGQHETVWNAANISSGVYLYKLTYRTDKISGGQKIISRKLLLLK